MSLGVEAVRRAELLVREHVADPAAQSETVDRFLAELEAMVSSGTTSTAAAEVERAPLRLKAPPAVRVWPPSSASSTQWPPARRRRTRHPGRRADRRRQVLRHEPTLVKPVQTGRRHQRGRTAGSPGAAAVRGQGRPSAYRIVASTVSQRWSTDSDLIAALQAREAGAAHPGRQVPRRRRVEDQLFRFGRILDGRPLLTGSATTRRRRRWLGTSQRRARSGPDRSTP